jgi:uncharacterized membrane protein (DUF2068 family)
VARQTAFRKTAAGKRSRPSAQSSSVLIAIGVFKLVKAILLVVAGIGAVRLLHRDVADTVIHWTRELRVDPDNRYVHGALARVFRVTPKQLRELSVGTFIYAGLFATEGMGLLLRKRWAEYFTLVTTGGFIPLEIYELVRHFTVAKVVIGLINLLIVWYLAMRVRSRV